MIAALFLALATDVRPPATTATLRCGRGSFAVTSRRAGARGPLAPVTQIMTVTVAGKRRAVALEPSKLVRVDGHRVRDRYVLTWACVPATSGPSHLMLGYACAVDPGFPGDCGGRKEWFQLLDDRGRAVNRGIPAEGPARDRLEQRLGIAAALADGVQMKDVLGP